jgi:ABC-type transport system substrate-binding protein
VKPTLTPEPTPSRPPATAAPSQGPFVPMSYPAKGDAPCGQAKAPDAQHVPYAGDLRRIVATDVATVAFELCEPDVAFLSRIAVPAFAINDTAWLGSRIDPAHSGAQAIVTDVNGTGPYRLESWKSGSEISLARNDSYWGASVRNERVIVRWREGAAGRLEELAGTTVDGVDDLAAPGVRAVEDDVGLRLEPRPGLNVFYLGFTNTYAPYDNERVRRAIAMGIDRRRIVERFFPTGSEVASHYTPCIVLHGCAGTPWYEFDARQGKELLVAAGYPDGFDTKIQFRAQARPYLPDPAAIAEEIKTQLLENLGIRAELVIEPEDTFLADADAGKLDGIHLLGQVIDNPDASAVLDPRFGPGASNEFGKKSADIVKALTTGHSTVDAPAREAAYVKANNAIRAHVPMIPVGRAGSAAAYRADVEGASVSPLRLERFAAMTPGDRRQLVWLAASEPAGLYCADETAAVAALVCAQTSESLYGFDPESATPTPTLATACVPNQELTVWTCTLRAGVRFADGAMLDANDVVLSYAVQWDAEHPRHKGRVGGFAPFIDAFGGLLNAPS